MASSGKPRQLGDGPGQQLPLLLVVSGPPCAGKTVLARQLATRFSLPLMTKDTIKEVLFDVLGWSDRAWSQRLGGASMELLYAFAEAHLMAYTSCIVEGNFDPAFGNPVFQRFEALYSFVPIQILCGADPDVLATRFRQRARSVERHPGHQDHLLTEPDASNRIPGRSEPLDIGGCVIELDMTVFEDVDYEGLYRRVSHLWQQASASRSLDK